MNRVFIGVDSRQPVGASVLEYSIHKTAKTPVSVTQIRYHAVPLTRKGTTEFTYSRYLAPYLCHFEGSALFLDSDMLVVSDINELFDQYDFESSVQVVPFEGEMSYERPSVMLFNCGRCRRLTPEYVQVGTPQSFDWADKVGVLPGEWNHLVGYQNNHIPDPKLLHYTMGIPAYKEVHGMGYEKEWLEAHESMNHSVSWLDVMGKTKHAENVMRLAQRRMEEWTNQEKN